MGLRDVFLTCFISLTIQQKLVCIVLRANVRAGKNIENRKTCYIILDPNIRGKNYMAVRKIKWFYFIYIVYYINSDTCVHNALLF